MKRSGTGFSSIRSKIILLTVAPILGVYVILLALSSGRQQDKALDEAHGEMVAQARQNARRFDLTLQAAATIARSTAGFLEISRDLSPAELYGLLEKNVRSQSFVYGSAIAFVPDSLPGKHLYSPYVCRAGQGLRKLDIATQYDYSLPRCEWWSKPVRVGKATWTEPYFDRGAGNILMCTYSVPFFREGRLRGVATVDIPLGQINERMDWSSQKGLTFFVVSGLGHFIYPPPPLSNVAYSLLDESKKQAEPEIAQLARQMEGDKDGFARTPWNGKPQWISYSPIKSAGWVLAVRQPESAVVAPARSATKSSAVLLVVSLFVTVTVIYMVVGGLLLPVNQLNRAAQLIASGHLDTKLDNERNDELGQLAGAFNEMAVRLRDRESTLRDSRGERLARVMEGLGGKYFTYSLNTDGTFAYVSPLVERALGYTRDEFARDIEKLFTDNPLNEGRKALGQAVLRGETPPTYEIEMRHRDGRPRRLEVCERPLRDEKGDVVAVDALVSDITDRVQATDWFRNLIEASPDAMVLTDSNGIVLLVNGRAEQVFGVVRDDIIGKSSQTLYVPSSEHDSAWNTLETDENGDTAGTELQGRRGNGETFPMEVSQRALHQDDGDAHEMVATVVRDVTERRHYQQELQRLNDELEAHSTELTETLGHTSGYLQGIMDNSPAAIWAKDKEGVYLFANQAYRDMFHVGEKTIVGRTDVDFFAPEVAAGFRENDKQVIAGRKTTRFVEPVGGAGGVQYVLSVKFPLYDSEGKVVAAGGICLDITEQRQLQEELRVLNEELEVRVEERTAEAHASAAEERETSERLRESQAQLQGILDNSPALIYIKDDEGRYQLVNRNWYKVFGREPHNTIGRTDSEVFPKLHAEKFAHNDRMVFESMTPVILEEKTFVDGEMHTFISTKFPLLDGNKKAWAVCGISTDITDLKRSELALYESQQRVRMASDGGRVSFMESNLVNGETWISGHVAELMTGEAEFRGHVREWLSRILPEYRVRVEAQRRAALASAAPTYDLEVPIQSLSNGVHWIQLKGTIFRDFESGEPERIAGIMLDVSENKQAEEALGELRRQNDLVLNALEEGIVGINPQCEVIFVNPAAAQMLGWEMHELVGRNGYEEIHHSYADGRRYPLESCPVYATMTDGRPRRVENEVFWRRDGSCFPVEYAVTPIVDEANQVMWVVVSFQDITRRREAEQDLRASEERYRAIIDNMQVGYLRANLNGIVEFINPGTLRILGYDSPSELIGHDISRDIFMDPGDRDSLLEVLKRDGSVQNHEIVFKRKDGSPVWIEDNIQMLYDESGQAVAVEGLLRDVTLQRQAREALEQAKLAADAANQSKSDFLANMSHEIRTPMNAIIGLTHLVLQSELTAKQKNYLTKIDFSARNLLGIVNDVLDFSKIEAGKLHIEKANFELEEVMRYVSELFAVKAEEKNLELLFRWSPDVPSSLVGDSLRIGQVLINLVGNALKFTEKGEIEVKVEKVDDDGQKVRLKFSVRDTGIGMTEEEANRLFQAFTQADASITRRYGGTGLGLVICRRLVEMMDGRIWIETRPGQGSTFLFTILLPRQDAPGHGATEDLSELKGLHVLVVDDNATARDILCEMLQSFGLICVHAETGERAVQIVTEAPNSYELILMDWQLPDANGIEVVERLTTSIDGNLPPVIMVSAYGREELMRQARDTGISGFLVKPVTPSQLLDTVLEAFGKRHTLALAVREQPDNEVPIEELAGARILLVEDNEINQEVACEILRDGGLEVFVAGNGEDGIRAIHAAHENGVMYDAILMDCQMPVMDGFQATAILRQDERFAKLPIIAMTANAMAGDHERCLAAGMDDYIAKPISIARMFTVLTKWVRSGSNTEAVVTPETVPAVSRPGDFRNIQLPDVDVQRGLGYMGGNIDLYQRILFKFRETYGDVVTRIDAAMEVGDYELATRLAHTAKGLCANMGAQTLQKLFAEMEVTASQSSEADRGKVNELLEQLDRELSPLLDAIQLLAQQSPDNEATLPAVGAAPSELTLLLQRLKTALEENDTEAIGLASELKPYVHTAESKAALERIESALQEFDFDESLEDYRRLSALLGVAQPSSESFQP